MYPTMAWLWWGPPEPSRLEGDDRLDSTPPVATSLSGELELQDELDDFLIDWKGDLNGDLNGDLEWNRRLKEAADLGLSVDEPSGIFGGTIGTIGAVTLAVRLRHEWLGFGMAVG